VAEFDRDMVSRPALIALNKTDLVPVNQVEEVAEKIHCRSGLEVVAISAREHRGLDPLVATIARTAKSTHLVQPHVTA
jgi:GTPase involved in cell partitioning and DNA repair